MNCQAGLSASRCLSASRVCTAAIWRGLVAVAAPSASPICTCDSVPWASGATIEYCNPPRTEGLISMAEYETIEHDVLVVGAGGAGLRAAIEASAAGVSVG